MKINQTTQTFEDMTAPEAWALREAVVPMILNGTISEQARIYFEQWRTELGYDDRQGFLLMTTAFPQRALLSLLLFHESKG